MTVTCAFTPDDSSPTALIHSIGTSPVLRGTNAAYSTTNSNGNTIAVPFPVGTVAGDLAIVAAVHEVQVNTPAGWTSLYNTNNQSGVDGACFYKVLTSDDITTGSVTVTANSGDWLRCSIATYENGADITPFLYFVNRNTGSPASVSIPIAALGAFSYFVWGGQWGTGAVTFGLATSVQSISGTGYSSSLGIYDPATNASVSETISFASSSQTLCLVVALTKGGAPNMAASGVAISAAASRTRWPVNPLYFETVLEVKSGTPSVGLVNRQSTFGASSLGTTVNSIAYQSDGLVRCNNVTLATISPFNQGDRISVAYHLGLKLIWFKVNAGSWNNNGSADPATFTGGIDATTFFSDLPYPAVGFSAASGTFRLILAAAEFAYSPPSGYMSIEEFSVTYAINSDSHLAPQLEPAYPSDWVGMADSPEDYHSYSITYPAGPIKLIAGEVREDDVGVEGRLVRMYDRRTGEFVGEARTNSSGEFIIPARDPNLPHFVVAFDDDVSPDYNAKVYDNVMPG